MRLFLSAIAIAVATAALLVGCNTGNGVVTVASTQSNLRIVNVIPNAGAPLVVTLDDDLFASGVAFQSLSPYQTIKAGVHTLKVDYRQLTKEIATTVAALGGPTIRTVMYGPITAPIAQVFDDTFTDRRRQPRSRHQRRSRDRAVDVYLTAPAPI
jgi:hypothetical protein